MNPQTTAYEQKEYAMHITKLTRVDRKGIPNALRFAAVGSCTCGEVELLEDWKVRGLCLKQAEFSARHRACRTEVAA